MKKKIIALLLGLCCTFGFALTACTKDKNPASPDSTDTLFTYSFETNGGSAVEGGKLYANAYIPAPVSPTRAGYEFNGWYYDEGCTRECTFIYTRMPFGDIVFYAGWTELVSITFETNGGTPVARIEGHAGDDIPADVLATVVTEKDNYVFEGWYSDEECTQAATFTRIPQSSVTLYAKWRLVSEQEIRVTYYTYDENSDSYTQGKTDVCHEGDEIVLTEKNPSDGQYSRFVGWALDPEGYDMVGESFTVSNADVKLYPIYRRKQEWARVSVVSSDYNDAKTIWAKKGQLLSVTGSLYDESAVSDEGMVFNGFRTAEGLRFDADSDVVVTDMELVIDVYSQNLTFEPVTTTATQNGQTVTVIAYYSVSGYTGNATEIIVPGYMYSETDKKEYAVAEIADNAFENNTTVARVVLPDTVEVIGANAFKGCSALADVKFSDSLAQIHDSAFDGCPLTNVAAIPESVYYLGYKVFAGSAFETALKSSANEKGTVYANSSVLYTYTGTDSVLVMNQKGVRSIAGGAFAENSVIKRVEIGGEIYLIGDRAFENCENLEALALGNNVQIVRDGAFRGCGNLAVIGQGNESYLRIVGKEAFKDCAKITSFVFPLYFSAMGVSAFEGCASLTSVSMMTYGPYQCGLTSVPARAFAGCTSLTSIMLLDAVTSIGESAFEGCTSLTLARIGYTKSCKITTVAQNAFKGCTALTHVLLPKEVTAQSPFTLVEGCFATRDDFAEGEEGDAAFDAYMAALRISVPKDYLNAYASSAYKNNVKEWDTVAPTITVKAEYAQNGVTVKQAYGFDIVAVAEEICEVADGTPGDELTIVVNRVLFMIDEEKGYVIPAADEEGRTYDLADVGTYFVEVYVVDRHGNSAKASFKIHVQSNEI